MTGGTAAIYAERATSPRTTNRQSDTTKLGCEVTSP
jgi:hypothetical protein